MKSNVNKKRVNTESKQGTTRNVKSKQDEADVKGLSEYKSTVEGKDNIG